MNKKRIRITDGGVALPLGNNTFLMRGRLHSQGGIGIGNGGKNDIEVEDGEVVKFNKNNIQVLSDQPMLNGISPANALLAGGDFNNIFKAQQSINGNNTGSYAKDGVVKKLINYIFGGDKKENNKKAEPLNLEELKIRQAYTESGFDSNAKSNKDAMGLFQIRQLLLDDYNVANGTNYTLEDLKDDKLNMAIRDWKMNKNLTSDWATKNAAPDSVVYAKALGGYNMGNTSFIKGLEKAKADGIDIYNSMDWIDTKWFPKETVDYINFILRNQNNSLSRNKVAYETSKKKNSDKVEGIRKGFKEGGEETIPTKEEYITQKLNNVRNNALEKSRNKTQDKTTIIYEADVYGKKELISMLQRDYNTAASWFNYILEASYKNYKRNNPILSEKYTRLDVIENYPDFQKYLKYLNDAKKLLEDAKNGEYKGHEVYNCIANLSEMFPHGLPYGNKTFAGNPEKYGFSLIDAQDVKPGDLIQFYHETDEPVHAMIYNGVDKNGKHTFNYSKGQSPYMEDGVLKGGYGTNKHYPDAVSKDGKHLTNVNVYRYTGTPQDSIQWSNEYDQKYGKTFKNGGQINMKLKNKNKQDITDIVMNEILPSSTGKRKRFEGGGVWSTTDWSLLGNTGLNFLSGLTQGIIGSINANKVGKMYDAMKRTSTYIPVAREHINTKVDVEPQLSATKLAEQKLINNAQANTSNSKVARQQVREAVANRITTDNQIYGDKFNKETALRNAEAELQTRYNLVDNENKLTDIREQNEFDMMKAMGKANAKTAEAQTWGTSIANSFKNIGQTLTDYATMTNDLLKSDNPETYDEWFNRQFALVNPKNFNDAEWLTKNKDWVTKYETQLLKRGLNKDWRNLIKG